MRNSGTVHKHMYTLYDKEQIFPDVTNTHVLVETSQYLQ